MSNWENNDLFLQSHYKADTIRGLPPHVLHPRASFANKRNLKLVSTQIGLVLQHCIRAMNGSDFSPSRVRIRDDTYPPPTPPAYRMLCPTETRLTIGRSYWEFSLGKVKKKPGLDPCQFYFTCTYPAPFCPCQGVCVKGRIRDRQALSWAKAASQVQLMANARSWHGNAKAAWWWCLLTLSTSLGSHPARVARFWRCWLGVGAMKGSWNPSLPSNMMLTTLYLLYSWPPTSIVSEICILKGTSCD